MPRKVGPRVTGSWLHPNDKYKSIFFDIFAFYFLLAPKKTENESTIFNIFMSSLAPINHQNAIFLGFIGSCLVTSSVISPGGRKVGGLTCQWGSYIIDPHRKSNPSETIYIYTYIFSVCHSRIAGNNRRKGERRWNKKRISNSTRCNFVSSAGSDCSSCLAKMQQFTSSVQSQASWRTSWTLPVVKLHICRAEFRGWPRPLPFKPTKFRSLSDSVISCEQG